ncbi:MAG: 2-oxo acid dehydrogenase subunit E2 [Bradyrhizobiaceae bacterium]|nr:2-oxo acid dehydrogenase subunit E2 [Bradyrhizobiaceae bacterium]
MFLAPVIDIPQAVILAAGALRRRPAMIETPSGDFVAVRSVGIATRSFDRRAFDGARSVAFLSHRKKILKKSDWTIEVA